MLKKTVLGLLLALITYTSQTVADTQVYRWVDKNGVVNFSDAPRQEAEKVNIGPLQSYSEPSAPILIPVQPQGQISDAASGDAIKLNQPKASEVKKVNYSFAITAPAQKSTLTGEARVNAAIIVKVNPELQISDRIVYMVDETKSQPTKETFFPVPNLNRGTHKVQAFIVNEKGEVIKTSDVVQFYVRQDSSLRAKS